MKVEGTIDRADMGTGTWALNGSDGTTYELKDAPPELQQAGLKVRIDGQIREDVMTLAAIGPVLEVNSFEILN